MNTHVKYYDIISTFNLLNFEIKKILFKITKINNYIIIQIITQKRFRYE